MPVVREVVTTPFPLGAPSPCNPCLADGGARALRPEAAANGSEAIRIDPTQVGQRIDGFGFALTDTSASLIGQLPPVARANVVSALFDPDKGIGVSWLRVVIGASDFTVVPPPWYSYRPTTSDSFAIDRPRPGSPRGDLTSIIPLLRDARQTSRNELRVFANPHSPPSWMKGNDSMAGFLGGRVDPLRGACLLGYCADPTSIGDERDEYARYIADFAATYAADGVPVYALGVQNEPGAPSDYPGMALSDHDQLDLIARVRGALAGMQLSPQLWVELPVSKLPSVLDAAPTTPVIDGVSYHCYVFGSHTRDAELMELAAFAHRHPNLSLHVTECTQAHAQYWPKTIDMLIDHARAGAASFASWNLALDPAGGPQSICDGTAGRCRTATEGSIMTSPVVVSGPPGQAHAVVTREFYEMGQVSKFVRPGAVRIASSTPASVGNVAFRNPDGSLVLVVHNRRPTSVHVAVDVADDRSFDGGTLPADGIATYVWPG